MASQERGNILYWTEANGAVEEMELPLHMLATGDLTVRPDDTPLEESKPVNVDTNNFDEVLKSQRVGLKLRVDNLLGGNLGKQLDGDRQLDSMKSFEPESVAHQVTQHMEYGAFTYRKVTWQPEGIGAKADWRELAA